MISGRIQRFWGDGLDEGPLVSVWLPEPPADLQRWDLSAQLAYWKNRREVEDDTVPNLAISNEAETMAAVFGVPVEYSSGSSWARPILASAAEGMKLRFDPGQTAYTELIRRLEAIRATPGFATKMIPVSGLSDVLSALRGTQDALMDIMEEPEVVAQLVAHLGGCCRSLFRDLLGRITMHDGGMAGGLSWMPGRGATFSADMMIMCKPEWFRDYIWPEEQGLLSEFDGIIYHLHSAGSGPALAQWISLHPKVRAIEISHDPAGPALESMASVLRGIQANTRLLVTGWSRKFTDEELAWMARNLNRRRLYLFQLVESPAEARAFTARVRERFR